MAISTVKTLPLVLSMRRVAKMIIKLKTELSALLASKLHAKCLISHKTQARRCFNYFKEFPPRIMCSLVPCGIKGGSLIMILCKLTYWYFLTVKFASHFFLVYICVALRRLVGLYKPL